MKSKKLKLGLTLAILTVASQLALAAPITFNFTFTGIDSPAKAEGFIIYEDTLLPNPPIDGFNIPDAAILGLSVTITGASAGNGTFGIDAFEHAAFDSNGGVLDFGAELVGQPTLDRPFGTTGGIEGIGGEGGDFNLFAIAGPAPTAAPRNDLRDPDGIWWFTLITDGGEQMVLTSMRAEGVTAVAEQSQITVLNGYVKLDDASSAPPNADCVNPFHFGRMMLSSQDAIMYVCTEGSGWRTVSFGPPIPPPPALK